MNLALSGIYLTMHAKQKKKEITQETDMLPFVTRHACGTLNPSHHSYLPGLPSSPELTMHTPSMLPHKNSSGASPCAQRRGSSVVPHCYWTRRLRNVIP